MSRSPGELLHDAMEAGGVSYHDRYTDVVDSHAEEIVLALLAAGWKTPDQPDDAV